eukprot:scaffold136909_cov21-Tisochrysis_lutea.AAC.3
MSVAGAKSMTICAARIRVRTGLGMRENKRCEREKGCAPCRRRGVLCQKCWVNTFSAPCAGGSFPPWGSHPGSRYRANAAQFSL